MKRIAIIGSGNMGGAIAKAFVNSGTLEPQQITCTAKSSATLERMRSFNANLNLTLDNIDAACRADAVILAVKPWLIESVVAQIAPVMDYQKQIIISVAAGIPLKELREMFVKYGNTTPDCAVGAAEAPIFNIMPNIAIEQLQGVTFLCSECASQEQQDWVLWLFERTGLAMFIPEDKMAAGMALASCGIAFALRYIRAAAEGGVELGFKASEAQQIVAQTISGAAAILLQNPSTHPEIEIDKVTTPGGITIKGLNEMEHNGFTSSVIKGLKIVGK